MSVHLCWVLIGAIWGYFVAWRWSEHNESGGGWFPDPWPFIVFLCAIIATLVLFIVHMKACA